MFRTLAAAALVVAFARPASRQKTAAASDAGIHHVVVIDGSASMQAGEPGNTRWDRALDLTKKFAASWGRGERWSVCLVRETPKWVVDGETVVDPAKVQSVLSGLTPGEGAVSWAKALPLILNKLKESGVELTIVSDDQASAWRDIEKATAPGTNIRGYWINTAHEDYANSALLQVRFGNSLGLVGHPCRLYVDVHNYSSAPMEDLPLEVLRDGAFYARETLSILPDQTRSLPFDVIFEEPGAHHVTVRLGKDMLRIDNAGSAGIDIRSELKVIMLRDAGRTSKFESAWPLLDLAARAWRGETAKGKDAKEGASESSPYVPILKEGEIKPEDLLDADVVVLDGGRTLTPELAGMLRDYVTVGGSLLLAPDATTDLAAWNRILTEYRLLPAPLSRFRTERLAGDRYQTLTRSDWPLSALRAFETEDDGDISNVRFYSWYEFGKPNSGVKVIGTFADRSPFLLRQDYQPGAVMLLAAGFNGAGGNLMAREFCLPYLLRVLTEAAAANVLPRVAMGGESASLCFRPPGDYKGTAFQVDNRDPQGLTPRRIKAGLVASTPVPADTWGLGAFLLLRESGVNRVWVGLQSGRPDSDLKPFNPQVRTRLTEQYRLTEVSSWSQFEEKLKAVSSGGEFHHWVILALLGGLIGEMVLERRFI
jgi:hypothetical protein